MRFNMNKKLTLGLVSAGLAGLFWACGDGEIMEIEQNDTFQRISIEENETYLDDLVHRAVSEYCAGNQECLNASEPGQLANNAGSSSSPTQQNPAKPTSNTSNPTSGGTQPQNPLSSGGVTVVSSPSHTQTPTSATSLQPTTHTSSSSAAPVTADPNAWGTCAANATNNAVKKGNSVQWKVSLDNSKAPGGVSIITKGEFSWTFEDGDPATKKGAGSSFQSVLVKYEKSGTKNASVTVSYNGQSSTIQCTPLNVTGAEITSCACAPNVTQVDIATNSLVTWTVSGCKSSDPTYSYEWSDGLQGTNAASGNLNLKGSYTPTVTVKNNDNGMQVVTCKEVIAIDSNNPDYIIKAPQGAGAIKLPAGKTNVALQANGQNNTVFCQVDRKDSPSGALNGSVNGSPLKGADYVSTTVAAGTLTSGKSLDFELDVPATCGIQ